MDFNAIVNNYLDVIKGTYTDFTGAFSGRVGKKPFWSFFVTNMIVSIVVSAVLSTLQRVNGLGLIMGIVSFVITIALAIPSLGMLVRRLHDTGKSGWYALLNLLCCVGSIVVLIFAAQDGETSDNQYGAVPVE